MPRSRRLSRGLPLAACVLVCFLPTAWAGRDWLAIYLEGKQACDAKRFEEALTLFQQSIAAAPEEPNEAESVNLGILYQCTAAALEQLNRTEDARGAFLKSLALLKTIPSAQPPLDQIRVSYAHFLIRHCHYQEARRMFLEQLDALRPLTVANAGIHVACIQNIGITHSMAGEFEASEALLKQALQASALEALPDTLRWSCRMHLRASLARCYLLWGRFQEVEAALRPVYNEATKIPHLPDEMLASLEWTLGAAHAALGNYAHAERLLIQCLSHSSGPARAHPQAILGKVYRGQGRFTEAEQSLKEAIRISGHTFYEDHQQLGALYQAQGLFEKAQFHFRAAVESVKGWEHPSAAEVYSACGEMSFVQGDLKEAERLFRKALDIFDRKAPGHPEAGTALHHLGILHAAQGRWAEADTELRKALALRRNALGNRHRQVSATASRLGRLCQQQLKLDEAASLLEEALDIDEEALGDEHPGTAAALSALAECHIARTRIEQAEALALRALRIVETHYGLDHPQAAAALQPLAHIYRLQGRSQEAAQLDQRIRSIRDHVSAELQNPNADATKPAALSHPPPAEGSYRIALQRGLVQVEEARRAAPADADTKRRAYTGAEAALKEALAILDLARATGKLPDPGMDLDAEMTRVRGLLYECRKNKPLSLK